MKRYIYVLTHGEFGVELVKSAEMIIGEMNQVINFSLKPGESPEELISRVQVDAKDRVGKKLFLVDLFGGTPFHSAAYVFKDESINIITGVNMPLLIESYSSFILNESDEMNDLVTTAVEGIRHLDKIGG